MIKIRLTVVLFAASALAFAQHVLMLPNDSQAQVQHCGSASPDRQRPASVTTAVG
jgi:hypothetical protein